MFLTCLKGNLRELAALLLAAPGVYHEMVVHPQANPVIRFDDKGIGLGIKRDDPTRPAD
jgi:hypothetical protein